MVTHLLFGQTVPIAERLGNEIRFYCFLITDAFDQSVEAFKNCFRRDVNDKLFSLQTENVKLRLENEKMLSLMQENNELKKMLQLKEEESTDVKFAKVVNIFGNDFTRSALIDAGYDKDIKVDDFAFNEDGLIGRVIEVSEHWSKILLIVDANSNIPAKINGVDAMLKGNNSDLLEVTMSLGEIKSEDLAETSSYGQVFREKIKIGQVEQKNGEFYVRPFQNFNALKYVCIGRCPK